MKNQQRLIVGLVLALVLIIFAVLNGQAVAVNFFGAQFSWPLIVVIIVSVLIGALITFLVSSTSMAKNSKALKAAEAVAANAKAEQDKAVKAATEKLQAQVTALQKQVADATAAETK
ncbi:lipopolysaccharide assembly protein LapA domain-containing protein [Lacticaseibacillus yichunensis]|uniref:Lipopolysaccharide assembly protein LapA domain-containing protein n=1 Tax=Lacticaseibacillus yichunensis TaxID=2486015 RepID=A0ABW4CS79_9LACO|nr:lipopolysaccharide assembly protein LapA domain-containing protein [Lacticaseibacillus yichunensis]